MNRLRLHLTALPLIALCFAEPATATPICPTCDTLDELVAHLKSEMPAEGSGLYHAPAQQVRDDWSTVVAGMLNGDCDQALPASLVDTYGLETFVDGEDGRSYCVLAATADADSNGVADSPWGAIIVNPDPAAKNLSIDVPHPLNDSGTPEQGIAIFQGVQARTFVMSGAHRDANDAACDCIDADYGAADAAHNVDHAFHASSAAILAHYDALGETHTALQFHGMGESTCADTDVYLTHGSKLTPLAGEAIDLLGDELDLLAPEWEIRLPGDTPECGLNGIGNVQGRLLNGVRADALCESRAWSYTGRFVHIEQKAEAREVAAYGTWIAALNAVDFGSATAHPGYRLLAPNGGEVWTVGEEATITWQSWATGDDVSLALYKDGAYYESITGSTDDDGEFTYVVEWEVEPGADYTVRIRSTADGDIKDLSDLPLTVEAGAAPPAIDVVGPNGGEAWELGTDVVITWNSTSIEGDVKLSLHKDGDYHKTIDDSAPNTGSYVWSLPLNVDEGADYTVRVRSVDDTSIKDFSDAEFDILAGASTPSLTVLTPNGGEAWTAGEQVVIEWASTAIAGNVKLSLHKNGSYHKTIATSTANDGHHVWTVSGSVDPGSDYTVRVRSVDDTSIKDFSDATFSLVEEGLEAENYPNPFNPETAIRYRLPHDGVVSVVVYDMLGQEVARLVDGYQAAGTHEVRFDARQQASGYYFYRVIAGERAHTAQMLLLK
jgi:hypothetical protein